MQTKKDMRPLYVDLDGTLIKTDILLESAIRFIRKNPLAVFWLVIWLFRGKVELKRQLAQHVSLDVSLLPCDPKVIEFLSAEREAGRKIILLTASYYTVAQQIADHLGLFDRVIATQDANMKGAAKVAVCSVDGSEFDYMGNDSPDFVIFKAATKSYLVNPTRSALRLSKTNPVTETWSDDRNWLTLLAKTIRIHQWAKNILLFVPLLVAAKYNELGSILSALFGFVLFSFLASATYILNDLSDLDSDRKHSRKRHRPIPSGNISISEALLLCLALFVAVLIGISFANIAFQLSIAAYLVLTILYTAVFKNYVIADVIALASLFTIRIIAGAMIIEVEPSFWLMAFSMFTFFSLALIKRCAELKLLMSENRSQTSGRDYRTDDYYLMQTFGVTSAFISLLIMAFYVQDAILIQSYNTPIMLWATLPAFAYWFCRMWLKTQRAEMHDDPLVFSVKDRGSVICISFIVMIILAAKIL
ncbi:hypothetical protein MPL1_00150 [Methylophaga lonarensis MPL]|uniref:UbiA prenyltransferase n=1 Tax=Methylophaga lonarensis MPL TaxID=1286106 RepID=M7P4B5_9GAMM|nr:UbiA family prenyltransferase [Methylophaga lonarensis]EMR14362.1 hypothetical protein MPL1_00150 [Methylophaga lonarensis MPL]